MSRLGTGGRIPRDRLEREAQLAIDDDRLELWTEGGLPFGLEPEALKRDHASRPRNLLIAEVFFRRSLIERWGRDPLYTTSTDLDELQRFLLSHGIGSEQAIARASAPPPPQHRAMPSRWSPWPAWVTTAPRRSA